MTPFNYSKLCKQDKLDKLCPKQVNLLDAYQTKHMKPNLEVFIHKTVYILRIVVLATDITLQPP